MNRKGLGVGAIIAVPVLVLAGVFSFLLLATAADANCNLTGDRASSVTIDVGSVPDTTISGYGREQLVNAAYVIQAGKALNLTVRDQTIGVMTAMGESGLRVLDYGDAVGPDSRGLFQQRDNGAWGSLADRMDPFTSSTNFFKKLATLADRDSLAPTIAANRVQVNSDPYYYEKYWDAAVAVVEGLTGVKTGLGEGAGGRVCSAAPAGAGVVNSKGWASPGGGTISSRYGWRTDPFTGQQAFTYGLDLAAGCGSPIYAINSGVIVGQGFDSQGNGYIKIDHGGGIVSRYLHMYADGMYVRAGDRVVAGQQIAAVGSSGRSTGCHLHLETLVNGENVDPEALLASVGIRVGE